MTNRRVLAAAAVAIEMLLLPAPARAQGTPAPTADAVKEAGGHFRHAVDLYKDTDYGGALVEFKRAYEIAPSYHLLFNLGQTYFQLQRWADALESLEEYLAQGGAQVPVDKRASVENDIRQLQNRVGQVEVKVNADGAQVLVDDELAGTSPLPQPLVVSVGHRKITALKSGLPAQERFVDVAVGDRASVALDFPAPVAATPVALSTPRAPVVTVAPGTSQAAASEASHTGRWIAWSATGVLAAATAVTGVLTLSSNSTLSSRLNTFPGDPGAIDSARTQAKTFGIVTDVLLGATVAAGAVAIIITATDHSRAAPRAEVGLGLGSVQIGGSF